MRFLRAAPAWGLGAGLLLLQQGDAVFVSRWSPATIALVHMFVLGVFCNAMLGSLLQFLPVVADLHPHIGRRLGAVLPLGLNLGLAGLVGGLLQWPSLLAPSGLVLAATLATYSLCALAGMRFDGPHRVLRVGLALVLSALLLTAALGLALALALSGWIALSLTTVADVHAAMGLLGTALLLAGTIGSVVLPMFQGTAVPHRGMLRGWMGLVLTALSAGIALRLSERAELAVPVFALPVVAFALAVLVLQWRAPHRRNPALVGFWRLGAVASIGAIAAALFALRWPESRSAMLAGVLAIAVALPALILGMLLEISAFLTWLELQGVRVRGQRVPGIDALLPESHKSRVLVLHVASTLALVLAVGWPSPLAARIAGFALVAAYGLVLLELWRLRRRGRRDGQRIRAARPPVPTTVAEYRTDAA